MVDTVASIVNPTMNGDWSSVCIASRGDYGIEEGLVYSFPVTCTDGKYSIVQGLEIDDYSREKMRITERELIAERDMVAELLQ